MRRLMLTREEVISLITTKVESLTAIPETLTVKLTEDETIKNEDKPVVAFTMEAHLKMRELVQQCSAEIAWYGVVERPSEKHFIVKDILVFPQTVSAASATSTDDLGLWLNELDDDTFNALRFHGHSHVNMGTTPSAIDAAHRAEMLKDTKDFFIYMILNKRDEYTIHLYDVKNNKLYNTNDIVIRSQYLDMVNWAKDEIEQNVKETPRATYSQYSIANQTGTTSTVTQDTKDTKAKADKAKYKQAKKEGAYSSYSKEIKPYLHNHCRHNCSYCAFYGTCDRAGTYDYNYSY